MMFRTVIAIVMAAFAFQHPSADSFYQAIRTNDLAALRDLVRQHGPDVTDSRRQTPLMLASAFGSLESMRLLIDAGADVKSASASGLTALHLAVGDVRKARLLIAKGADINARSQMGRTPLLVAAHTHGASETVRALLDAGADPKSADAAAITPLLAAASVGDTESAKLLLNREVDVNAQANIPAVATPLMAAARGNLELARLLLSRKASAGAVSQSQNNKVLNGTIQFGAVTPLHLAALSGEPEIVRILLSAGAPVDAHDVRGMTPLMWAVSTDRPNPAIIRMLKEKGASLSVASKEGENVEDWARKFNNPAVLETLGLKSAPKASSLPQPQTGASTARAAVERGMPILQASAEAMLPKGGCVACHAQPVTHMASLFASQRGWIAGGSFLNESLQTLVSQFMTADQPLLQGNEGGGLPDGPLYSVMAMAEAGAPSSWNTDVLVYFLAAKQRADGNWKSIGASRAPIQDGDFSRTAMALRALTVYGIPARRAELDERIKRGAEWLSRQIPVSTEDRVMQLLGLKWANANTRLRETRTRELLAEQRADGGWAQTPHLSSDAYATGQVLFTLNELGVSPSDEALRQGVEFLIKAQQPDGSWYVSSRAMKIQPYFESGFPYDHDQWISATGSAWAVMGLSRVAPDSATAAR